MTVTGTLDNVDVVQTVISLIRESFGIKFDNIGPLTDNLTRERVIKALVKKVR
jgi:hypothetical protein